MSQPPDVASLLHVSLPFEGRERRVELAVPPAGQLFPLISPPALWDSGNTPLALALEFKDLVRTLDGQPVTMERAHALVADDGARARLLDARNRLYEAAAAPGRVIVLCPVCRAREAALSPAVLAGALGVSPWPIVADGTHLALPYLADVDERGARPPGLPTAARVRFELPAHALGLEGSRAGGVLGETEPGPGRAREIAAWERWVPETGHPYRSHRVPGFRAVLRLALALERLNDVEGEVTPDVVATLPATDAFFLDNLYYLTHAVSVPTDTRSAIVCGACGALFLPVR
jgi:hypothetical protein